MPKIKISKSDLPEVAPTGALPIRFRIVSDSRNIVSEWSQVYLVYRPEITNYSMENVTASITSRQISSLSSTSGPIWNISLEWKDGYGMEKYDIYAQYIYEDSSESEWNYLDTVNVRAHSFTTPPETLNPISKIQIVVTQATYIKNYLSDMSENIIIFHNINNPHLLGKI